MKIVRIGFVVAASVASWASAQDVTRASRPAFDVASVKPCKDGEDSVGISFSPGGLNLTCLPLKLIISMAYGEPVQGVWNRFPMNAIEGGPAWINMTFPPSNGYRIDAKTRTASSVEIVEGPMLRALLEERFNLKVRRETRQVRVYALTVDRRGARLKNFDASCTRWEIPAPKDQPEPDPKSFCVSSTTGRGNQRVVDMHGITLATFANVLGKYAQAGGGGLDGPIVDRRVSPESLTCTLNTHSIRTRRWLARAVPSTTVLPSSTHFTSNLA